MVFPPGIVITFHIVFIALNTLMFFGHLKFEPHKSQPSKIRTMRAISDATGALGFTAALNRVPQLRQRGSKLSMRPCGNYPTRNQRRAPHSSVHLPPEEQEGTTGENTRQNGHND